MRWPFRNEMAKFGSSSSCLLGKRVYFLNLLSSIRWFRPNGLFIIALGSELALGGPVSQHSPNLGGPAALRGIHQMDAIRRPNRVLAAPLPVSQLLKFARRNIHY